MGGTAFGRAHVDRALLGVAATSAQVDRIRTQGYAEAQTCTALGLGGTMVPALLGVVATVIAATRRHGRT